MERCIRCQYYDRAKTRPSEQSALRWGQCRRGAPLLSPINAKASMIEGVWPTVRDDDWCGEWKAALPRRAPEHPAPARPPALDPVVDDARVLPIDAIAATYAAGAAGHAD